MTTSTLPTTRRGALQALAAGAAALADGAAATATFGGRVEAQPPSRLSASIPATADQRRDGYRERFIVGAAVVR